MTAKNRLSRAVALAVFLLFSLPSVSSSQRSCYNTITPANNKLFTAIRENTNNFYRDSSEIAISIDRISTEQIDGVKVFKYKHMIFNGIIFGTYSSGNIQFRWKISNGLLDGISVGFFDSTKDNIRYIYNYERGKKQGDQYEYYLCEEAVPNYSFDDSTIHDFDKTFFGNLDNNFSIDFYQSDGCRIKTDSVTRESIYPSRSDCPTGQLHVFYYAHPGPGELFTKCYGISKCFWRSFKRGNTWWFD